MWPGLDPQLISKHLEINESTVKGHMNKERANLQSTTKPKGLDDLELKKMKDDFFPDSNSPNEKTHEVAYSNIKFSSNRHKKAKHSWT